MVDVQRVARDLAALEGWDEHEVAQVLQDYIAFLKSGGKQRPSSPESVARLTKLRTAYAGGDITKEMALARRLQP
jgi:hypothetical protein